MIYSREVYLPGFFCIMIVYTDTGASMRKFLESELQTLAVSQELHTKALENVLHQIQGFAQTLMSEIASKEGPASKGHAIKGLVAIDDFVKKNLDVLRTHKDRREYLTTIIERYDKNKKIADKIETNDERKFRKVGEKPVSIREERNVKNNLELYNDDESNEVDI